MKVGTVVIYNAGSDDDRTVAIVEHVHKGGNLDLVYFPRGSAVEHTRASYTDGVPKREPPYGDEGGGGTWHPVHT